MIQLCCAEDGHIIELAGVSLWDLERLPSLDQYLSEKTGIPPEAIFANLSDGRRLRHDNIRDLAGVEDQTIFLFNKRYLDIDLNQVFDELRVTPALQPPVEESIVSTPPFRISQIASSYVQIAQAHYEQIHHTLTSMHYQHSALRISSSSLDLHALAISDVFDALSATAQRELKVQSDLLAGVDADLSIAGRVIVHKEFMSPNTRRALEQQGTGRTLVEYVNRAKMKEVADRSAATHVDLQARFERANEAVTRLSQGTDEVRVHVTDHSLIEDAETGVRRSQDILEKIEEISGRLETAPVASSDEVLQELRQLDAMLRGELQSITSIKNAYTEQCILVLRRISTLNNDVIELPSTLSTLRAGFKAATSFTHIQRLHNMLYYYGVTVVEVVRRKEFARFFYQRAQSILEIMAKLSANERKRRQLWRGEVHGQLPFVMHGMDDPVPSIDFSPEGSGDSHYSLERKDVEDLMRVLDDLEHFAQTAQDPVVFESIKETRAGLEKLIGKMDSLESTFDRIAERSLLSTSRLLTHRRRSAEDDQVFLELQTEIQELRQSNADQQTAFDVERNALQNEISQLRKSQEASDTVRDQLERDLHATKAQLESEATSRRIIEQRHAEVTSEADGARTSLADALAEATEQTKAAEVLRQQLAQARAQFEDVKALEKRNADKVESLLEEQARTLQRLEEARSRGEDLEAQIQAARNESEDVKRALIEAGREKDRLLRAQASEHDRLLRDHIAEADGDRAVLEHQFTELRADLENVERQLKDARAQAEMATADAVGLREELQRVEHELREARHVERVLRDDLRAGRASQSDFELQLENSGRLVAQILDVALAFRDSHVKALVAAQTMVSHPGAANRASTGNASTLADSTFSNLRHSIVNHLCEPSPIDPSDPAAALEALRAFDHDHFLEAINKAGSTIRKWQKQCKEYRERAKGKISFRNFAKGDLALFLPTRNSVSKPWAAFNVSFPHYFLQATGHLAEQLKSREWIVARITSITERVVDQKDPSTNPYGLGDGVKYYMLEVEDWTHPHVPSKRRDSSRRVVSDSPESPLPTSPEPRGVPAEPPEPESEDSFAATRPPNSHLFPARSRSNSSPTAGPSSLSRLLAQAVPSEAAETITPLPPRAPSPTTTTQQAPPSPTQPGPGAHISAQAGQGPAASSPRRPGSRASRVSSSSRFSVGRVPFGGAPGAPKAAPTTAVSENTIATGTSTSPGDVPSILGSGGITSVIPSPDGSPTDGISNVFAHRRRTSSFIPASPRLGTVATSSSPTGLGTGPNLLVTTFGVGGGGASASSRLASLASSWGVTFGRRNSRKIEPTEAPAISSAEPSSAAHNSISGVTVPGGFGEPIMESPSVSTDE